MTNRVNILVLLARILKFNTFLYKLKDNFLYRLHKSKFAVLFGLEFKLAHRFFWRDYKESLRTENKQPTDDNLYCTIAQQDNYLVYVSWLYTTLEEAYKDYDKCLVAYPSSNLNLYSIEIPKSRKELFERARRVVLGYKAIPLPADIKNLKRKNKKANVRPKGRITKYV